jgi:hypothetical protein
VPRSLFRASAAASAVIVVAFAFSACTQAPSGPAADTCSGIISKVLLSDDSGTTATKFDANDVPKIFDIPGSPAPTCYYTSVVPTPAENGIAHVETHRTLLYVGISDSEAKSIIESIRKTVSAKLWTVRFDDDKPIPTATPAATASPAPAPPSTTSARWYYNFAGSGTDDKGQLGYYLSKPVSAGTAQQAGLDKAVNVLRVETELLQVKK